MAAEETMTTNGPKPQTPKTRQPSFVDRPVTSGFKMLQRIAIFGILAVVLLLFLPAVVPHRETSRRMICALNLKQIGLALHCYSQKYRCFPPAYVADKNGKPMHSWRVLILPYLDQGELYRQYDFSEPWNSPHNARLMAKCPEVFRCPIADAKSPSTTNYVAVVGEATCWPGNKSVRFEDIKDGASNTVVLVEIADSDIPWTEPRDMSFDHALAGVNVDRQHGISSNHGNWAFWAFADGSVQVLFDKTSPQTVKACLTIAGGETINEADIRPERLPYN
jgi:hypothetical protein